MARIAVVAPRRGVAHAGNRRTASRWCCRLTELGHTVIAETIDPEPRIELPVEVGARFEGCDLMVTLHARRTAAAVRWWRTRCPDRPLVVGLAGTDLYRDLPEDRDAWASLRAADRLVVLQPAAVGALRALDSTFATKASVVFQSVDPPIPEWRPEAHEFRVVVLAHLRDEKDPLLAARAVRHVASSSRVFVHLAGAAHDASWAQRAEREQRENRRFTWHRALPPTEALDLLASAQLAACTSRLEGGANAVTEAMAIGVPVVGTKIDGNTGLLGGDYPGLVPVGDGRALAERFDRLATDGRAYAELRAAFEPRRRLARPAFEREAWAELLTALGVRSPN